MSRRHRIIVVLVAYHSDRWLPDCVATLAESWHADDRLVIVDNSGNTRLGEFADRIVGTVVVTTPSPLGFAEANNFGLVESGLDADAVCFLNQDTLSGPGWLNACLECLDGDPRVGAVSPLLTTFDGAAWDEGFAYCVRQTPELACVHPTAAPRGVFDVPQLTAAALVVRANVLRQIGPFDPVFGSYYEDFDLCRRVREAGYRLTVCGDGTVRHFGGSSTQTESQQLRRMQLIVRNRAIHRIREGRSNRLRPIMRQFAMIFPWNLLRAIARTPSSQPAAVHWRAHLDLVRLMPRLASERRDVQQWQRYLQQIDWHCVMSNSDRPPAAMLAEGRTA